MGRGKQRDNGKVSDAVVIEDNLDSVVSPRSDTIDEPIISFNEPTVDNVEKMEPKPVQEPFLDPTIIILETEVPQTVLSEEFPKQIEEPLEMPLEAPVTESLNVEAIPPVEQKSQSPPHVEYVPLKTGSITSSLHQVSESESEVEIDKQEKQESNFEFFDPPPSISMRVIVRIRPLSENELANKSNSQRFVQGNSDNKTIQVIIIYRLPNKIIGLLQYHLTESLIPIVANPTFLMSPESRK